jgi:MYXO-CTERM domain-containing protein
MQKTRFSTLLGASVLASSLLVLPITPSTLAQTMTPTPEPRRVETVVERDNTGLWGLLGLVGLVGLAGLRRRPEPEPVRVYTDTRDPRERSKV